MRIITGNRLYTIGNLLAVAAAIAVIWLLWSFAGVRIDLAGGLLAYSLLAVYFLAIAFVCQMILMPALFIVFGMKPITYTVHRYEAAGFSIKLPDRWKNVMHPGQQYRELVLHVADRFSGASINVLAGPQAYGPDPSISDLEAQAARHLEQFHAVPEYRKPLKIGGIDALELGYTAMNLRTKKMAMVRNGIEYIVTCSAPLTVASFYEPVFDECLRSFAWLSDTRPSRKKFVDNPWFLTFAKLLLPGALAIILIGLLWVFGFRPVNFNTGLFVYVHFLGYFITAYIVVAIPLNWLIFTVLGVVPFEYGTYTNEPLGFSIKLPQRWRNAAVEPGMPEVVVHAVYGSSLASLKISAAPRHPMPGPSIEELEVRARKSAPGVMRSLRRTTVDGTDAVEVVYEDKEVRTKKLFFARNGVEYVIECSAVNNLPKRHEIFERTLDKCLETFAWKRDRG